MTFVVTVRRFFCLHAACPRRIFAERLAPLALPYARRTTRLCMLLTTLALTAGGEPGARLSQTIGAPVCAATMITLLRRLPPVCATPPQVLGVDDWSFRRHREGGTILVDLERGCPIDLLRGSDEQTFATWLAAHPGSAIISRDRGQDYTNAATQAAPQAMQVADRWHLLHNVGEVLTKVLSRHSGVLRKAAHLAPTLSDPRPPASQPRPPRVLPEAPPRSPVIPLRGQRAWQLAMYDQVHALASAGYRNTAIAAELGITRKTVRKYLRLPVLVDHRTLARPSSVEPYRAEVEARWAEGGTIRDIWRYLQTLGFTGSYKAVGGFTHTWNPPAVLQDPAPPVRSAPRETSPAPCMLLRTCRQACWLLQQRPADLRAHDLAFRTALCAVEPELATLDPLIARFRALIRERQVDALPGWIADTLACGVKEFQRFALSIQQDQAAVTAALVEPWSNGPVEGQVNRLKVLKRQMYDTVGECAVAFMAHYLPRRRELWR